MAFHGKKESTNCQNTQFCITSTIQIGFAFHMVALESGMFEYTTAFYPLIPPPRLKQITNSKPPILLSQCCNITGLGKVRRSCRIYFVIHFVIYFALHAVNNISLQIKSPKLKEKGKFPIANVFSSFFQNPTRKPRT